MAQIKEISTEQTEYLNTAFLNKIFDEIFRMERRRSLQKYLPITAVQNFLMFVQSKEEIIVERLQSV